MNPRPALLLLLAAIPFGSAFPLPAEPPRASAVVHSEPLHAGRIDPKLFGNFIELLDDVAALSSAPRWVLNDRSFEGVTPLANWCYYDGKPDFCDRQWDTNATWTYDTVHPFNGARAAELDAVGRQPGLLTQSGLTVDKGLTYAWSGWLRADSSKVEPSVQLKARLPNGQWMTLASAKLPTPSGHWQKYSARLTSGGQTDRAVFELRAKQGRGSACFADQASLVPLDNLRGWRRDVVEAISNAQPALVRWGGSVCDPGQYRWKDGIGDRDLRAPFPNKNWGRIDPNDVGIDEFCQFCELVNAQPLICASFFDGAPSAADLVAYCNGEAGTTWGAKRAANGHPAPYRVHYFQIGNEISGNNPDYLRQFPAFVAGMKAADPAIAILSSYPSQNLLDRVGKSLSYVSPNHYTPDFTACDREFSHLAQMLNQTPGCAGIKIAVTEWNVSGGDWGLGRGRQMTLETALLNARYVHVLMRHSDKVEIACRSNLANSFCGGLIETSPGGILKRPAYYVMQLFARHARPIPLRVVSASDILDLVACGSEDKSAVTVFAVNSRNEPIDWAVEFAGFPKPLEITKAEGVCDTLDARQTQVMNHWETPGRVKTIALPFSPNHLILPALSVTAIECN